MKSVSRKLPTNSFSDTKLINRLLWRIVVADQERSPEWLSRREVLAAGAGLATAQMFAGATVLLSGCGGGDPRRERSDAQIECQTRQ